VAIDWDETLRAANRWFDVNTALAEAPAGLERSEARAELDSELAGREGTRAALRPPHLNQVLLEVDRDAAARARLSQAVAAVLAPPALIEALLLQEEVLAERRLAEAALVLSVHRSRTGRYPASAQAVTPEGLAGRFTKGTSDGYVFRYQAREQPKRDGLGFVYWAQPVDPRSGASGFCLDDTGRMWMGRTGSLTAGPEGCRYTANAGFR
jgi:hypothetical protein